MDKVSKILIVTQKIDINDSVLGFFHRWILEFAKHCERVTVICLQKGEYHLPENVKVFSLGKEEGRSKVKYLTRFFQYLWLERKNYDTVFVHMNQEYVLLGGFIWRMLGKKILLWRNHKAGNVFTRAAVAAAHTIFCTSKFSFVARYPKTQIMPAGIDTEFFQRDVSASRKERSVLYLGRLSTVKKIEDLIKAARELDAQSIDFSVAIFGSPKRKKDVRYEQLLKRNADELMRKKKVSFYSAVAYTATPPLYNTHEVCVNMTPSGSLDKTILEAMACETVVLVSNQSLCGALPDALIFKEGDACDFAEKIANALALSPQEKNDLGKRLRNYIVRHHSIGALVEAVLKV